MVARARGMALIQALLIVAAIAAVATALLIRAEGARERLEWRFAADQANLYLDSAVSQIRLALPDGTVSPGQDWARPREGVVIDRGTLAWSVEDLEGRFNVNLLVGDETGAFRAAFLRLAAAQGLPGAAAERVADELGRYSDDAPVSLTLMLRFLAGDDGAEGWAALEPLLAAWPRAEPMNVNTMSEPVLAALTPDLTGLARDTILRRLAREPVDNLEDLRAWITARMGAPTAAALGDVPLGATSRRFVLNVEARLDSVVLRRSVVVDRGGDATPGAVLMSLPRP